MKNNLRNPLTAQSDHLWGLAKAMFTAMGLAILFGWIAGDGNAWENFDSISSVVFQMLKTKLGLALFVTAGGCLAAELVKTAPFLEELK